MLLRKARAKGLHPYLLTSFQMPMLDVQLNKKLVQKYLKLFEQHVKTSAPKNKINVGISNERSLIEKIIISTVYKSN